MTTNYRTTSGKERTITTTIKLHFLESLKDLMVNHTSDIHEQLSIYKDYPNYGDPLRSEQDMVNEVIDWINELLEQNSTRESDINSSVDSTTEPLII